MTATTTPTDDVLEKIHNHPEVPQITPDDTLIQYDNKVFLIHDPGEVTCLELYKPTGGELRVNTIVRLTHTRPETTPADTVYSLGRVTCIEHGPGRQTRVIDTGA